MLPAAALHSFSFTASGLFHIFAQIAAPLAVASLWQGTAFAAALALCFRVAPRITAAQRFAVWFAGFGVLAALPFLPALALRFAINSTATSTGLGTASPHAWLELDLHWSLLIAALWLAASTYRAADLLFHAVRIRTLWHSASLVDAPAELTLAASRQFDVCSTQLLDRPSVIGFFAPRILIPHWLVARLTSGELRQIVLHEAEHLRRRDDWTNLLQKLCLVVFPLNPALWWIDRRLAKEREMACDEGVVRITRAPRAYAACLASLAERGLNHRQTALSLGAWQRRSELVVRVQSLLRSRPTLNPLAARAVLATVAIGLLGVTFELARCPQLVGFASTPSPSSTAALASLPAPAGPIDAVYTAAPARPAALAHFRAISAVAQLPVTNTRQPLGRRPGEHRTIAHPSTPAIAPPQSVRTENLLARSAPAPASHDAEQWIVFTEWEQVETAPSHSQAIADYDTRQPADAAGQAGTSSASPQQPLPTRSTRVTRLIFHVVPSSSNQPTAIPFANGWIVIQL
ncbi:MAG TPA: M56 family metallopeptidase [Terracidiphilus sp.]|jgi:beta-lactamase regulating signal transducer with metallopeptidase domain|nr:M56 family metallopeptidase [Terracidiphilus sp.]